MLQRFLSQYYICPRLLILVKFESKLMILIMNINFFGYYDDCPICKALNVTNAQVL